MMANKPETVLHRAPTFSLLASHVELVISCLGGSVGRVTALKAGGRGFESHLRSLFFYENRKEGSQVHFFALPL